VFLTEVIVITVQQAQAILQFLSRTQINGAEAPAFMECVMALRMIAASHGAHEETERPRASSSEQN
jgi:hypothetical protein